MSRVEDEVHDGRGLEEAVERALDKRLAQLAIQLSAGLGARTQRRSDEPAAVRDIEDSIDRLLPSLDAAIDPGYGCTDRDVEVEDGADPARVSTDLGASVREPGRTGEDEAVSVKKKRKKRKRKRKGKGTAEKPNKS